MRIVLAGGGSGGHVTPLRAIVESLQTKAKKDLELTVISDRAFFNQTKFLFQNDHSVELIKIYSGKFRRYNTKSLLWHIMHLPTLFKNLRDIILIIFGTIQMVWHFIFKRPDIVFCKGGYVCVPVGLVTRLFNIPLIIHDSDTHAGLTNRLLSRWATLIGTGMPSKYYNYPKEKMMYSGIPVAQDFMPVSDQAQEKAKQSVGFDPKKPVLFVTGGGTGAQQLNSIISSTANKLLVDDWQIIQLTGKNKAKKVLKVHQNLPVSQQKFWKIIEFTEVLPLVQAADIIVSRAGATAMQEFANAKKTVVLVPSPYLTGGHQLKNAQMFQENKAALILEEADLIENPELLVDVLADLRRNSKQAKQLAESLHKKFAKPEASDEIAEAILNQNRT